VDNLKRCLGLDTGEGMTGEDRPPPLLTGFQVDDKMEPVLFWRNGEQLDLAAKIVDDIFDRQVRVHDLKLVQDVQSYLLSLGGNKVFVSNPGTQNELAVDLASNLKSKGYPCFQYKEEDREPGRSLEIELEHEINESDLFVALIDASYWESAYCRFELELAVQRWERRELRILIYNKGSDAPIPPFLKRNLFYDLAEMRDRLPTMIGHVEALFRSSTTIELEPAEAETATQALSTQFDLSEPRVLLTDIAGLDKSLATELLQTLEQETPSAEQLLDALVARTAVDRKSARALARLLSIASRRVGNSDRDQLRRTLTRQRLYPHIHCFSRWEAFARRDEIRWLAPKTSQDSILSLLAKISGENDEWLAAIQGSGQWFKENSYPDRATREHLAKRDARLCIECTADQLSIPYEWATVPDVVEPLGRWRPVRRHLTGLAQEHHPDTLDRALANGAIPPPRILLFGYGGPELPRVDRELKEVRKLIRRRYQEFTWPDVAVNTVLSPEATRDRLERELQDGDYLALHICGHAGFEGDRAFLALLDASGNTDRVYGDELREWMRDTDLRFVFLNVCVSAQARAPGAGNLGYFRALVTECVEAGVTEVVSHLWPVLDDEAYRLAVDFYSAYVNNEFDAAGALMEARQRRRFNTEAAWGAPLLVSQGCTPEQTLLRLEARKA